MRLSIAALFSSSRASNAKEAEQRAASQRARNPFLSFSTPTISLRIA